jgi:hypothetical protein
MQTWRSEYKAETPAAAKAAAAAPVQVVAKAAFAVRGPAKLEFQQAGSKWLVENHTADSGVLTVTIAEMKETVYIYGCVDTIVDIKGKCKSIVVDGCKKTKVSKV